MSDYQSALAAIWVICVVWWIQWLVATASRARRADHVPGVLPEVWNHQVFAFRAHRTFMNSMENLPLLLATAALAIAVRVQPELLALCLWTFALARLLHMLLYYRIATELNPSPRSYPFLSGVLVNLVLLGFCGLALW